MRAAKLLLTLVWLAALVAALAVTTTHTTQFAAAHAQLLDDPPLARLDTRVIDVVTLGHRGLWDDLADIWILQILVDPRIKDVSAEDLQRTLRNVTRHGPKLETLYMLSCFVVGLDMRHPELCEPITLDGLKAFPASWRIPVTQGFISYYKMNDPKKGALYYGLAASREGAPAFLAPLAKNLTEKHDLSVTELQETLDQLLDAPGGSKLGAFLKERQQGSGQNQNDQNDQNGRP